MSNASLSGMAHTVLGPVSPDDLGPTTTHEHLLIDFKMMFRPPSEASERPKAFEPVTLQNLGWVSYDPFRSQDNLELLDEETAIDEVQRFKAAGGRTIVEATTFGIGRDPHGLVRIARATGVNIVMGAGYYVDAVHPNDMDDKSDSEIADEIVAQLTTGVDDTGVRAGIIGELGCTWPLTDNERKVLRGGARAQRETGAAILIHPGRDPAAPFEVLDVLAEAGADTRRVIIGHLDRTITDVDILLELARRGPYLEYDLFGWEVSNYSPSDMDMPNDAQRIAFIERLVQEGHADQVVIAHDMCFKSRLASYGGHGYSHILENIVPRMRARGIPEGDIDSIVVANPARVLTYA